MPALKRDKCIGPSPAIDRSLPPPPQDLAPHLIYARISGYGQTGPKAREAGYASVCEAYGGFRGVNGFPGEGNYMW